MGLKNRRKLIVGVAGSPIPFYPDITWENNDWIAEWLTYPTSTDAMDPYGNRRYYGNVANKIRNDESAPDAFKSLIEYPYIYFNIAGSDYTGRRVYVSHHPFLVIRYEGKWLVCATGDTKRVLQGAIQTINQTSNKAFTIDGVQYYKCTSARDASELDVIAFANHQIQYVSP